VPLAIWNVRSALNFCGGVAVRGGFALGLVINPVPFRSAFRRLSGVETIPSFQGEERYHRQTTGTAGLRKRSAASPRPRQTFACVRRMDMAPWVIKREREKTRNIPNPLFDPPEARSKAGGESPAPTLPGPPRRAGRVKGACACWRRRRRAEPRGAQLLREHGEHAEEPLLEAPSTGHSRNSGPYSSGENSIFHENRNSNNTSFMKGRIPPISLS
jgi:hypothetical protein